MYQNEVGQVTIECKVSAGWVDIPTPLGPDMQLRWAGHTGTPDASGPAKVHLEYRVKPSSTQIEAGEVDDEPDW